MGNKRDIKVFVFPVLIFFTFLFSIIGYKQELGAEFTWPRVIYSIITCFAFENIRPGEIYNNAFLLVGRYLAAILLGFGVYTLLYGYISSWYARLKIKYAFRRHVIVFSTKVVGRDFVHDLLANHYKVILVEHTAEADSFEKIEKDGVIVFRKEHYDTRLFDNMLLSHASACVIAAEDDSINIDLTLKLIKYLQKKQHKNSVRILTHIKGMNNLEVMRDHVDMSKADENFELDIFNINSAAAKKIYDHFPPHNYFNFNTSEQDNAIAVVGYNQSAEDFIIENLILSHYQGCNNIKVYLVDKEADNHLIHFMYKYPFCADFIDLVPVKLLNNKFLANFNASKGLLEKLGNIKAAYFFGNEGAELIDASQRLRQFLYSKSANYLDAPIVVCFPEDTNLMSLLDAEREHAEKLTTVFKKQLNIHFVNMIGDTCTSSRLLEEREYIDLLSRIINYYYAIKYEFCALLTEKMQVNDPQSLVDSIEKKLLDLAGTKEAFTEKDIDMLVLEAISSATKKTTDELRPMFSVKKWWEHISYHKKSANRYAARHMAVKMNIMKNLGCLPLTQENIVSSFPIIAPTEHKRWCAEKMVLNYRYGVLPKDRAAKNTAKELLKIHDQLIPYEELTDSEKQKDLNIFLLMPLLNSLKAEIKK